jgi:two-component system phosphate regulon sensor histidine kinase PhoR
MYSRFSYERRRARKFKRRYQRLVREFRKSTGALPDGGIILNDNFEIIRCNEQAQRLVGVHPKKDRGQRVDNILRDPRISQYLDSDARPETVEIESPVLDHTWLSCRLVPYGAEQHLLLVRDITETRKLIVMRRDFVANASHELRSPLTVISGYLDSLADDEALSRDWQKPIEQMQAQAARMNNIVKELLELSRLEASGPVRTDRAVDVCAILASSRKAYAGLDDTATVTVQCESSACLLGNEGEIESIVSNLLSNAIRHTRRDGAIALSW